MIFRWANTIAGRVTLFLLLSLVVAQLISLFFLMEEHERNRVRNLTRSFFSDLGTMERLFNSSDAIDRRDHTRTLSREGFEFWVSRDPPISQEFREPRPEWELPRGWADITSPDKRVMWHEDVRPLTMRYRLATINEGGPLARGQQGPPPEGPPPMDIAEDAGAPARPPFGEPPRREFEPPELRGEPGPGPRGGMGRPPQADGDGPPPPRMGLGPRRGEDPMGAPAGYGPRPASAPGIYELPGRDSIERAGPPMMQATYGEATSRSPRADPNRPPVRLRASLQLADGEWLNGEYLQTASLPPWFDVLLKQSAITLVITTLFIIFGVGVATKKLSLLAVAADKVGRGESLDPIPESGTAEVRGLTQAFNTMSLRLRRFLEARTQMLGAISHDLRTPITGLRLRAELVDDDENRERMLAIVDEIHHLTEATLALAKEDSFTEVTDRVDLSSLIESIVDDLTDVGIDVACEVERNVQLSCRPYSLRRAIRNLAENGAKYGHRSRITMATEGDVVRITIDDDGPGIPEDQLERVLLPFVRLETSRSRQTGGAGLGLAITRSIVLNHGGELKLANRPEGGLRATMLLPRAV